MSNLGRNYRLVARNKTGVALAGGDSITITGRRWKAGTSGAIEWEASEATLLSGGASLSIDAFLAGTSQDNSSNAYYGGEFKIEATVSTATPNGSIEVWLEKETDGGTFETPSANYDYQFVAALNFTATGTKRAYFDI